MDSGSLPGMTKNKGYTIIELLLVCALVLIVCTIGVPQFFNKTSHDLHEELSKLEIIFMYNQQRALATNQAQKLTVDPQTQTINWTKNNKPASHTLAQKLRFGFLPNSFGPPSHPTSPITEPVTFSKDKQLHTVEFLPNGKISSGSLYLIDQNQRIMGALTSGVSQVSYIRRYVYQEAQWIQQV